LPLSLARLGSECAIIGRFPAWLASIWRNRGACSSSRWTAVLAKQPVHLGTRSLHSHPNDTESVASFRRARRGHISFRTFLDAAARPAVQTDILDADHIRVAFIATGHERRPCGGGLARQGSGRRRRSNDDTTTTTSPVACHVNESPRENGPCHRHVTMTRARAGASRCLFARFSG
jgi:hypothetical protein